MKTKQQSVHQKSFALLSSISISLLGALGCVQKTTSDTSTTQAALQRNPDRAAISRALAASVALQINLKTNRVTLFKSGKAVDQWNVASADVSGEFHDKVPQATPTGVFAVEDMQACPVWLPRHPKNPLTGKVAENEKERQEIFKNNPDLYGPCGAKNPLGQYVIWFDGEYGVHGNAAEWILELANPEERRVSGGCIRNPNEKIRDLFHLVMDTFPQLRSFKTKVDGLESATVKKTLTQSLYGVDMKVVVGHWPTDVEVEDSFLDESSSSESSTADVELNSKNPRRCEIVSISDEHGIAPTHSALPASAANIDSFYSLGDEAFVQADVIGMPYVKTVRGFLERKYLGSCRNQN